MPLVCLEVENFKSYRGKQTIGPFYSFSAVIGPNGAGKSNVMDAISFVLGVRSNQLRSSQLKDLIFRGRRLNRDPEDDGENQSDEDEDDEEGGEGTAKKASVTAVYRDTRGVEHRFQRSVTLSGQSEYRLNNRVTQFSKYNEKLEQFNILVKAKNFLVFQGDVEAVASQNSKDLSKLIDQISGSLELKPAYEEAKERQDRAIENSNFNYNRRRGINAELKGFKEMKGEAERFENLLEEKEAHIVQHLLWKLFHIEQNLTKATESIEEENDKLPDLRGKAKEKDAEVEKARKSLAEVQKNVMKMEKNIRRKERDVEEKKPNLISLSQTLEHSRQKRTNAKNSIESTTRDLEKRKATEVTLTKALEDTERARDQAVEEQRRAMEKKGMALSKQDLAKYHELKAQANTRAVSERQQLETLSRDLRSKKESAKGFEDKLNELESKKNQLQEEETTLKAKKEEADKVKEKIGQGLKDVKEELRKAQEERNRINSREITLNDQLQVVYNKILQASQEMRETEREVKMKETFKTLQNMFPGVRGRLIDLVKPTQRKYETAIATVLGHNMDSIIVDHEKTAIDCIQYLREQRSGQATFIPLDTINTKPVNDRLRSISKGARLAIDVIDFPAGIERALQHACGSSIVCDTLDVARFVVYEKKQDAKAVTLDGTVIHKSGLITGGQTEQSTTKRWDEREYQGLQRQRDQFMAELKELNKERRTFNVDDELTMKITKMEAELANVNEELSSVNRRLQGISEELKVISTQERETRPKLQSSRTALNQSQTQVDGLLTIVNREEDAVFQSFCSQIGVANIREYEESQLKLIEKSNDQTLEFETQSKRIKHQLNFVREEISDIESRLTNYEKRVEKENVKIKEAKEKKNELEENLKGLEEEIEGLKSSLNDLNQDSESKRTALDDAKRSANKASKNLENSLKNIASSNDEIERLASERSGIYRRCRLEEIDLPLEKGDLNKVPLEENNEGAPMDIDEDETQRAIEVKDYGIEVDFSDLDDDERADGGSEMEQELQGHIDSTTAEIEKMTPNMKAVDRLDDTESKLAETEAEFEAARTQAKEARDEFARIKKQRCDLFNKAYNHISERIDQVYKDLTKGKAAPMGGVAYLSLEDTEEPYLSGIRYHAMPPMKRFRDMDQLSGGEKTMAALALLFAVHSYQPAPFFVLDEVDAALDSQNVAKVSNYIRQHASDAFQFIVISLKASLYERSQALVGIYRDQQENSSATLTLDLEKYNDQ